MLAASSPIEFPPSSSPLKRNKPHDHVDASTIKPRASAPFILEDDEDSEAESVRDIEDRATKKPRIEGGGSEGRNGTTDEADNPGHDEPGDGANQLEAEVNERPGVTEDPRPALWSRDRPLFSGSLLSSIAPKSFKMASCGGKTVSIKERQESQAVSYESMVAARSKTKEGRAKRNYYGIAIHELMASASQEIASAKEKRAEAATLEELTPVQPAVGNGKKPKKTLLWTEKYRARNFMDLCGDDGTNRVVLRWLKKWDPIVFPGIAKSKPVTARRPGQKQPEEEKPHRKILLLTGPPGLGKTTLAHVCAKQAGYDVMEINASDDRSRDVVKNRIRTSLGTETVRNVGNRRSDDSHHKIARPACVIVDEVDGVVSGSGGSGEGGFVKALIDLVLTDQRNSNPTNTGAQGRKKKGDDFRLMRPLILICNDVYHPSLRPLRQSSLAEIIHVGRPVLGAVVGRLKTVFEKEGVPCDQDAARKLCEAAWGMTSGIDAKKGAESTVEGDLRGVMVVGEWVAGRFKSSADPGERLSRQWIERNIMHDLTNGAAGARGLGRGNVKDIVSRIFMEGGGFPKQAMDLSVSSNKHEQPKTELGFGEQRKKYAMERLAQMTNTSGDISHIVTEIFAEYPNREFNDDCYLTKPNQAYDWLHFHDACQSRLYASQEWELAPYLSQPVLACHHLFAAPKRSAMNSYDKRWGGAEASDEPAPLPFTGPRADYQAYEAEKQNRAQLQAMQGQLTPSLSRSFRSAEDISTEFLPYLVRMVAPEVKPVVVGGSTGVTASVRKETERAMVKRAADVLADVGIELQKGKIETEVVGSRGPQFVYRMEPDIDALSTFETASNLLATQAPARYAVRQVLDQELQRTLALRQSRARQARFHGGGDAPEVDPRDPLSRFGPSKALAAAFDDKENIKIRIMEEAKNGTAIKKDFFGRVVEARPLAELDGNSAERRAKREEHKVWVTFHEGLNNAVRKPISLQEFMKAF